MISPRGAIRHRRWIRLSWFAEMGEAYVVVGPMIVAYRRTLVVASVERARKLGPDINSMKSNKGQSLQELKNNSHKLISNKLSNLHLHQHLSSQKIFCCSIFTSLM